MIAATDHDYIQTYELSVRQLDKTPDDRTLQHQAVLALARAGSLDFAIAEYARYGLADIRHHEDIMALGGRLFKDLYLRITGKPALEYARESAYKYEAAFQDTGGYYSGINSASMALMANMPTDIIQQRAQAIHQALPDPDKLSAETRYFIEATRAESLLLLGQPQKAKEALHIAIEHDPLNYTSHATTIKQFRMIVDKLGNGSDWLSVFTPPRSVHFAGHIFGGSDMASDMSARLSDAEMEALSISISDVIQREDIGFGFGALAGGADILIAESLLDEGAELHLIFPTNIEAFMKHSVLPFGNAWKPRFEACLKRAASVNILSSSEQWPEPSLNRFLGQVAMGQAILRAKSLSALSGQLLLWNQDAKTSYTAVHANDWRQTGRDQTILPFPAYKSAASKNKLQAAPIYNFQFVDAAGLAPIECPSAERLAQSLLSRLSQPDNDGFAVHINLPRGKTDEVLSALITKAHTNQILISEIAASILAFTNEQRFQTTYAGQVSVSGDETIRAYNLHIND